MSAPKLPLVLGLAAAGVLAAFFLWPQGGPEAPGPEEPPPTSVDAATAGTISGIVRYEGPAPAPTYRDFEGMQSKGECSTMHHEKRPDNDLLVQGGLLQNAIVHVASGLETLRFRTPQEPLVIDQLGCLFVPRIAAVQVGQPVRFLNSDPTKHNVKATPSGKAKGFNIVLARKGSSVTQRVTAPELAMRLDCDYHGWMRGWLAAFPHPFFQVTGEDGAFSLGGLPPGDYEVAAWHERLGRSAPRKVRLGPSGTERIELSFPARP